MDNSPVAIHLRKIIAARGRASCVFLPPYVLECCWSPSSAEAHSCCGFLRVLPFHTLTLAHILSAHFPAMFPELGAEEINTRGPFRAGRSEVTCSQHLDQLRVSAVTTACDLKKLLWTRLQAAVVYGYKHKYLITCSFSKITILGLPMTALVGFWPSLQCPAMNCVLWEPTSLPSRKWLVTPVTSWLLLLQ